MISRGTRVMLWNPEEKHLVLVDGEIKKLPGLGVLKTQRFIGKEWGERIDIGRKTYRMLKPSLEHAPDMIKRGPQIIQPHMGSLIAHYCDISCGNRVIEGGAGSGIMSMILCRAVGTTGKVYTYEIRDDHLRLARSNVAKLGMRDIWEPVQGDVTSDVKEKEVDVFVVDIPEPWEALEMADQCLKNGGRFAAYVPTMNQLQRVYLEMKAMGFIAMKSFENLHRDLVISEDGTRPSFEMLGHTGYVVVGFKGYHEYESKNP